MNAERSQTETSLVEQLRDNHQAAIDRATSTGIIPPAFEGDPTFRDAVNKRRKNAEAADRSGRAC